MLQKISVSYRDDQEIITSVIVGDIIQTKPFGLFVINTVKKTERFFSNKLWVQVEFGEYKKLNPKYKVVVDLKEYIVSSVEFDTTGLLTLSIFAETKNNDTIVRDNKWMLVLAPGTFDYVQTSKL
jgi:hypothetical protein